MMRILLVAVLLVSCSDGGVRHTPDATHEDDAAIDAAPDAALAPAMLSGSPGATAFGSVALGQATAKVTYTISNDGDQTSGTLAVLLDSTTAGFSISDNHCSGVALAARETCTFAVYFQPSVAGLAMTTVHAGASPGGDIARDLTGTGLQPGAIDIVEASHDFLAHAVDAAQPATHTFTVKNTGQVPTGVPMPEITGTANSYTIASTTCTAALAPNATCAVVVHFAPQTVGMKPASLVATAMPGGSDSATLAGTGFAHVAVTKRGNGGGTVTSNLTGINCGSGCAADFTATPVALTAAPDTGSVFAGWMGDCAGTMSCSLDLTAGKAVSAAFTKQQFTLTTGTTGTGQGTVTGAGTYDYNTPVTVTETPATGSTFGGWSGACTGPDPCVVTMTQARSVTATFTAIPETLTVTTAAPNGVVTSTPAGISCRGTTCTHDFDYHTPVTLNATPDTGYRVAGVAGDCTALPCTVTMDQARSVTVRFAPQQFTLTTATAGSGQGTVTGAGTYDYNTPVTVTETPATGSTFGGWSGACTGPDPCVVTMTQARSVTATFTAIPETLTVTTAAPNGVVTSTPAGISCRGATCTHDFDYGMPVTLTATPDTGYRVAVVAGDCTALPCTVTMDQARSVTVRFAPQQFTFSLGIGGDAPGSVTVGSTTYTSSTTFAVSYGQQITLTEAHQSDWLFGGWGGACSANGRTSTCTLTITSDTSASAVFQHVSYQFSLTATTQTANALGFSVTYPLSVTTNAECASSAAGTQCTAAGYTFAQQTLVAHPLAITSHQPTWVHLPTWTGCDSVSADQLTCTYTITGAGHAITVSGDMQ